MGGDSRPRGMDAAMAVSGDEIAGRLSVSSGLGVAGEGRKDTLDDEKVAFRAAKAGCDAEKLSLPNQNLSLSDEKLSLQSSRAGFVKEKASLGLRKASLAFTIVSFRVARAGLSAGRVGFHGGETLLKETTGWARCKICAIGPSAHRSRALGSC